MHDSVLQEMGERSVVEQGNSSQAPGEGEEAVSRFSGGESGKTWTSDEVQVGERIVIPLHVVVLINCES